MFRLIAALTLFILAGCGMELPSTSGPELLNAEELARKQSSYVPLSELPERTSSVTLAIYDIPDKTGANLRTENFAEFSKAVSQGADAFVVQALSEVGNGTWFRLVERESIEALMQERRMAMSQIEDARQRQHVSDELGTTSDALASIDAEIEAYRQRLLSDYQSATTNELAEMPPLQQALLDLDRYGENQRTLIKGPTPYDRFALPPPMPEVLIADYIVTGAVVAHDSDVVSGGTGLRFQNIGVLQKVQKDVITVNLRFVRVSDGEIVASQTTSQTVLSKKNQGDILNYVTLNQILEFESGIVTNEPRSLALNAAFRLALSEILDDMDGKW